MSPMFHAAVLAEAHKASVSGGDKGILVVVAVVAVFALLVAAYFAREVLAADQGTPRMQDISRAVQEGAAAYLRRQFTTLAPFAVIIFALLFILPAATTADNVGDNVGDCAGMAADLFESYAVTLVASLILGQVAFGQQGLVFPLIIPAIGVITAILGILVTAPRDGDRSGLTAINRGFFISAIVSAVLVLIAAFAYLPSSFSKLDNARGDVTQLSGNPRVTAFLAVLVGLVLASAIQVLTGYFTETERRPVQDIARQSLTGAATVILGGFAVGLESAVYSAVLIGAAVYVAFLLGHGVVILSLFAVALAGTGLLTTVGVIVAMDTFGPISDNAQGIAEMSGDVTGAGAQVLTNLDAVGNTTKAITKGIAIATAVLAASALFGSFATSVNDVLHRPLLVLSVNKPNVLFGLIIGAAVVFLFSSLAISAVSRAAGRVVMEVREQFRTIPA